MLLTNYAHAARASINYNTLHLCVLSRSVQWIDDDVERSELYYAVPNQGSTGGDNRWIAVPRKVIGRPQDLEKSLLEGGGRER